VLCLLVSKHVRTDGYKMLTLDRLHQQVGHFFLKAPYTKHVERTETQPTKFMSLDVDLDACSSFTTLKIKQ
jgi:hypothetical protein